MANSKLLLASIAIALVTVGVRSDTSIEGQTSEPEVSGSALRLEIEGLRSKISALESSTEDRIHEVKTKEDNIARLNGLIQEKLSRIASLESEIESLQKKGDVDAKKLAGKADAQVGELEKQIVKLRTDIEAQSKKGDSLAAGASEAEKKVQELNLRLKYVHAAWLPPWLAIHVSHIQELAVTHWNEHAKPSLVLVLHKASDKLEQVQKWAEPHFNTAKTEWIPAAKEQLLIFKSNVEPYLQKISTKTFELYEESKSTIGPHFVKLQEVACPYFQEAKEFSKPYIDQVVIVTKPFVEKLLLVPMPYKKHVARAYHKSLRTARTFHRQIQDNIHKKLKKHELTKPHATKELAWFMASALLALPVVFLYRVLAAVFCKKAKKPRRTAHASHTHRRPKRRHAKK